MENMVECYKWSSNDFCLNPLPLNHYSGLVYCLLTPFFVGSSVDLLPKFNAEQVWHKLLNPNSPINVFIAVPTIYSQLIQAYLNNSGTLRKKYTIEDVRVRLKQKMRIIASGSAPLNLKTFNEWFELTRCKILERYGMTEIGMALSTPYLETSSAKRIGGTIGRPCGRNKCRISESTTDAVLLESDSEKDVFLGGAEEREEIFGELQISGPNVFKEYLNKPEETKSSFTNDGWFKTGIEFN